MLVPLTFKQVIILTNLKLKTSKDVTYLSKFVLEEFTILFDLYTLHRVIKLVINIYCIT